LEYSAHEGKNTDPHERATVRIEWMDVEHYRGRGEEETLLGTIGENDSGPILDNDQISIRAQLSAPAYYYLIALHPNGEYKLYYPEGGTGEETPPTLSSELSYPSDPLGKGMRSLLTNGVGLQGYVLVVSRKPLPPYRVWRSQLGHLPWTATQAKRVWHYDGLRFEPRPKVRSDPVSAGNPAPEPFALTCDALKKGPGIDAIEAWAFPVLPEDEAKKSPRNHAADQKPAGP
jgi:hypothetical protein